MHRKILTAILLVLPILAPEALATPTSTDFKVVCDTLTARCRRQFTVRSRVRMDHITKRGKVMDLHFTHELCDFPWHEDSQAWFRNEIEKEWGDLSEGCRLGNIYADGIPFEDLATPAVTKDGTHSAYAYARQDKRGKAMVERSDARYFKRGLSGRHIAIWQSHGKYYNNDLDAWKWQRATVFRTVEDMYTQSYVLNYVVPMLENAGAYVLTPRERDAQAHECVCDNDAAFKDARTGMMRTQGKYKERGRWENAGEGFADALKEYTFENNPFTMGTARKAQCSITPASTARWTADIAERGQYAVYVSYKSLENSCKEARYTVHHLGGNTEFKVDQTRGGSTWIYLGTFEFAKGKDGYVELDNKGEKGEVVTADGVRFGGGMGKVRRGESISGMPAFTEGALYSMVYAGIDSTIRQWSSDYTNDYATRGAWTKLMKTEKNIPFDLSMAFHTDAGTTPDSTIIGTLSIYTLLADESRKFSDGEDRMSCRALAEMVQDEIVNDIRTSFEPKWNRRMLWDRSYSESRTTDVPAMLLELLSHQNFADMTYGLNPEFQFTVGRAIYKGMLKFLGNLYGCDYTVQPLPVKDFAVRFDGQDNAVLTWNPREDPAEPTAVPNGYMLYTRVDDGGFDAGVPVISNTANVELQKGHIYSFKVAAVNEGGLSFPSEVLAIGRPSGNGSEVLVVNNFDRVSAPAWVDTPDFAGFNGTIDNGVPYMRDITYIGDTFEYRRSHPWESDDNPGCGACYSDKAGEVVAGNTFDYAYVHGKALMALGHPFSSMSRDAFVKESGRTAATLDLICGKQVTSPEGSGAYPDKFKVFPAELQKAITDWTSDGGNVIISGSKIGTDVHDSVYPRVDTCGRRAAEQFVQKVLGYKMTTSFGGGSGKVGSYAYWNTPNPYCYCVENPDGIRNSDANGKVWLRYPSTGIPAAVSYKGHGYGVIAIGVPVECIKKDSDRKDLMKRCLDMLDETAAN